MGLLLLYAYGASILLLASYHLNTDMILTYLSGEMLNMHIPGYHFSQEYVNTHHLKTTIIPNLSPPFLTMITAFIVRHLSYQNFFIVLMSSFILLNIGALSKLYKHFYFDKNKLMLCAFILANFFYMPTFMNTTFGQVALLLNALVIFCYLSLEKKQHARAGFFLALAINIKLFFGIFCVYFLAKKQYRALVSFILFSLVLALLPLLFYGPSIYQGYFDALNHIQWYGTNWNASWNGFFSRIFGETSHRFYSILFFPKLTQYIYGLFFLIYTALIYYFTKKHRSSSLAFAFTLSSMLLISPLGWSYYFPILVTALLINITAAESNRYYNLFICLLLFSFFLSSMPFPIYPNTHPTSIIVIFQGNLFFISLFIFNSTNLLQLILFSRKNKPFLLPHKIQLFIFLICLLPSIIGISGVIISLSKHQTIPQENIGLINTNDSTPSTIQ